MKRKLMLYDEPTSGQDGENLLRTAELIRAANKQAASTLIVTHDPELILRCATPYSAYPRRGSKEIYTA